MLVTYHEGAVSELAEAVAFYNRRAEGLGQALAAEVRATLAHVLAHPDIGTPVRTAVRRVFLRRFPYSILYDVAGETLLVLAVMHHRRRPEYWANRR